MFVITNPLSGNPSFFRRWEDVIKYTPPNYSYTKKYVKREHRFNFRKDKLIKLGYDSDKTEREIMFENGYDRIWDTGNLKFEMTF
jgi:hypothetical protein